MRVAMALIAIAQMSLTAHAISESRLGTDARSHAEAAGTSAHHAHDVTGCATCAARALLSVANGNERFAIEPRHRVALLATERDERAALAIRANARPRAPPLSPA